MTTRTIKRTVVFERPFVLGGFDEVLLAGTYSVETDEELLDGISFPAYRRISTLIRLPTQSGNPAFTRALTIDPTELDAALLRDQATAVVPVGRAAGQKTPKATPGLPQKQADRRAIERGEGEGKIAHAKRPAAPVIIFQ